MADLIASMMPYMTAAMSGNASQSVTITRGGQSIGSSVLATYGATTFEQDTETGIVRWEAKDFLIPAASYTLASVAVEPQRGDKITDANGNTFEVLGDNGLPPFRYTNGHRVMLRIHTKQVISG
jgi:hypothetical protein